MFALIQNWLKVHGNSPRQHRRVAIECVALERRLLLTSQLAWTAGVALPSPETNVSAYTDSAGRIELFGNGSTAVEGLKSGQSTWTNIGSINSARSSPAVGYLGTLGVVVYGGADATNTATDGMISFGSSGAVQQTSMNTPRSEFAFASTGGLAFAIGGVDDGGVRLASVEAYDQSIQDWAVLAPLPVALSGAQAVYDNAGHIDVFGGTTAAGVSNATFQYNIAANSWTELANMPTAEADGAAVLASDGTIVVLGGLNAAGNSIATVQRFDPIAGVWITDTPLPQPISHEAAVVDSLGRIEVIGGENTQGATTTTSSAVFISDVKPVFTSTPPANPTIVVGNSLTYTAVATGTPDPTYSLVNPPGNATIDAKTGAFTFTPTLNQTGKFTFDIRATNALSTTDQTFQATVKAPAPTGLTQTGASLTTISLAWNPSAGPVAYYRVYMDFPLSQYIISDHIVGNTLTISGLTSQIAGHSLWVSSVDTAGNESLLSAPIVGHTWTAGQLQYTSNVGSYISIPATHKLVISLSNPGAVPAPTSYSIVSGAPAGMTINSATGVITWTPTDAQALNGYFPTVMSTNAAGTSTLKLGIAVQINYPIMAITYPGATGSTAYANLPFQVKFGDTSGAPVTFKLNSAPAGATISSDGTISWTPTIAQAASMRSVTFNVTATNYAGSSTNSVIVPLLTASAPGSLSRVINHGLVTANWTAPQFDAAPIVQYTVILTYSYSTSGSGRGGGGSHTHTGSTSVTVSGKSLSASLSTASFGVLPGGRTRYTLTVIAKDASGVFSQPASITWTA